MTKRIVATLGLLLLLGSEAYCQVISGGGFTGGNTFNNVNLNAALNPKAYGASGSSTTITCNTTANSSTLTGCSAGDFVVGQNIRIKLAGAASTASTPGAPTVTPACVGTGCSTTGTHSYSYQIAAFDSTPNGALTAPGTATTVTSIAALGSNQIAANGTVSGTATHNAVSWSAATGAVVYLVCRAVDGGSLVPWALATGTSFTDYGVPFFGNRFQLSDYGLPATCAATRNNVFATITSIVGSTITIGAQSTQPKFRGGAAMPSQPAATLSSVTVEHDDTLAFRNALAALRATAPASPKLLDIPAGTYNLNFSQLDNSPSFQGALDLSGLSNTTINCAPRDGSYLLVRGNGDDYGAGSTGMFTAVGDASATPARPAYTSLTYYPLTDPVNPHAKTITFSNPGDESNFSVGDTVFININSGGYPGTIFGETNFVESVDTTNHKINLVNPTTKAYSATYYSTTNPYNSGCTSDGCMGAPQITDVTTGGAPSAVNIAIQGCRMKVPQRVNYINQVNGWRFLNNNIALSTTLGQSGRDYDVEYANNRVNVDSLEDEEVGPVAAASDINMYTHDNYFNSTEGAAGQNCEEGSAHIRIERNFYQISNYINQAATGTTELTFYSLFGGGAGCFDFSLTDNKIDVSNTNLWAILYGSLPLMQGQLKNNMIQIDASGSAPYFARLTGNPPLMALAGNKSNIALSGGLNADNNTFDSPATSSEVNVVNNYGGLTLLGGLSMTALADPSAPSLSVVGGGSGTNATYYVVCHSSVGVSKPSSSATISGPASLSSSNYILVQASCPAGYTNMDILKADTAHSLALAIPTDLSNSVTGSGTQFRDTGQSTSAYTASTSNTTGAIFGGLFPSNMQIGYSGTGSLSNNPTLTLHSDFASIPSTHKLIVDAAESVSLESNTNAAENAAGSWQLQLNASGGQINYYWTPNGGGQVKRFLMNSSGTLLANGTVQADSTGDANVREIMNPGSGLQVGPGTTAATTVINESQQGFLHTLGFINFYSAAGTAIPACNSTLNRSLTCVSDETSACTGGNTYASGGTNKCMVQCDGTNWKVNSVLCYGS